MTFADVLNLLTGILRILANGAADAAIMQAARDELARRVMTGTTGTKPEAKPAAPVNPSDRDSISNYRSWPSLPGRKRRRLHR